VLRTSFFVQPFVYIFLLIIEFSMIYSKIEFFMICHFYCVDFLLSLLSLNLIYDVVSIFICVDGN